MKNFRVRDGFNNVYKSLGSKRDITTNTSYTRNPYLSLNYSITNGLYSNPMGGKIVDVPVEDAFKGGRVFTCENQDKIHEYKEFLKYENIDKKISKAMKWAKIFGSAVIIVISDDDEMSEPLNVDNIRQGDIKDLIVLDRWQMYSMNINRNPMSSKFLEPDYYYVTRTSTPIHHSRVFKIDGLETTLYDKELMNGWGLSVYERLYKAIMNAQLSPDLIINILQQLNLDIYHIDGLNEALSTDNDELALKRIEVAQQGKSIFNGVALDSKDQYTNITKSLAGTKDVNDIFMDFLSMASDIPKTRLMGLQNAGLANDGAGDLKNYYDRIEGNERKVLRDAYNYLDPILSKSLFGEELDFTYELKSLFMLTDEQKSIMRNRDAQTNQIYLNTGVISEMEAKETLVDDNFYSTITAQSIEEEKELYSELDDGPKDYIV